jgi:hypothetical protein
MINIFLKEKLPEIIKNLSYSVLNASVYTCDVADSCGSWLHYCFYLAVRMQFKWQNRIYKSNGEF